MAAGVSSTSPPTRRTGSVRACWGEVDEAPAHMLEPMVAEAGDLGVPAELKTLHGNPATTLTLVP